MYTCRRHSQRHSQTWWRHQMETFSALLAISAGNSPVPGEFPTQRPVTRSFDVYFDLRLNKRLCKQSWGWWFETLLCPLWRHSNGVGSYATVVSTVAQSLEEVIHGHTKYTTHKKFMNTCDCRGYDPYSMIISTSYSQKTLVYKSAK